MLLLTAPVVQAGSYDYLKEALKDTSLFGISQKDQQAIRLLEKSASQGNEVAQVRLGDLYKHGRGVPQDFQKAVIWYRKAAEQENAIAQVRLGIMYRYGFGVLQDFQKAAIWYRKAAEQKNASGQAKLGDLYKNGRGVSQNDLEAIEWYKKAAEQGDEDAQTSLGLMYEYGRGVLKDNRLAAIWYLEAIKKKQFLAEQYLNDLIKKEENMNSSKGDEYKEAAEQGDAEAQGHLGSAYAERDDYQQAIYWYKKAAEQGNAVAQLALGTLYSSGKAIPLDDKKAFMWYTKSAEQGNAAAQNALGRIYINQNDHGYGAGVPKNYREAVKWLRKAVENNKIDVLAEYYQKDYNSVLDDIRKSNDEKISQAGQGAWKKSAVQIQAHQLSLDDILLKLASNKDKESQIKEVNSLFYWFFDGNDETFTQQVRYGGFKVKFPTLNDDKYDIWDAKFTTNDKVDTISDFNLEIYPSTGLIKGKGCFGSNYAYCAFEIEPILKRTQLPYEKICKTDGVHSYEVEVIKIKNQSNLFIKTMTDGGSGGTQTYLTITSKPLDTKDCNNSDVPPENGVAVPTTVDTL